MYCVKCKQKTGTINLVEILTKNNRLMLKGLCSNCGSKKASFVKNVKGKGLFNEVLSILPELHLPPSQGEFVSNGSFNNLQKFSDQERSLNKEKKKVIKELMKQIKCVNFMISFITRITTHPVEILAISP